MIIQKLRKLPILTIGNPILFQVTSIVCLMPHRRVQPRESSILIAIYVFPWKGGIWMARAKFALNIQHPIDQTIQTIQSLLLDSTASYILSYFVKYYLKGNSCCPVPLYKIKDICTLCFYFD